MFMIALKWRGALSLGFHIRFIFSHYKVMDEEEMKRYDAVSRTARVIFLQLRGFQNTQERHWAMRTGVCSKENPQACRWKRETPAEKKGGVWE